MAIVGILRRFGHDVFEATDGAEALKRYIILRPDLVVMDIEMPVMDGLNATRAITEAEPGARVVILTARAEKTNIYSVGSRHANGA